MADSKKKSVAGGRNSLNLKPADATRNAILRKQQKQIQDMYANLAKQTAAEAERLKHLAGATPALQSAYLTKLSQRLTAALNDIQAELTGTIKANAQNAAQSVVNAQREYLKNIGMPGFQAAFSHVPRDVVQSLFTGNVYGGNWTPSKSIWGTTKHNIDDIHQIVAKGIAENKSSFDIAKELERYVDPKAAKTFDWGKVYPGSYKKIDYNAQRLARTLTAHAYQQSLVNTCAKNPFITGFKWESGHTARTCEICNDRDGQIYSKTDLPLDHPNGTCTWVAVSNASSDEVVDRLANWVNGGKDPDLDVWAKSFVSPQKEAKHTKEVSYKKVSPEKAQSYTDKLFNTVVGGLEKLTSQQIAAIKNYAGDSYKAFNTFVSGRVYQKGGSALSKAEVKNQVQALKEAISKSKLPEDLVLYRGASMKELASSYSALEGMVGSEFQAGSFLSTSLSKEIADGFVDATNKQMGKGILLEIHAKKGSAALPATAINKVSNGYSWLNEAEMLLNPGQALKVLSVSPEKVVLEVM